MRYSQERLEELWKELGDVPFSSTEDGRLVLDVDWLMFERFTEVEVIWEWFDEEYEGGVHTLMFEK